ncbi:MAG: HPP family protein [Woeseiaceae bacterium]|jgi:CBS-domain-containing membrane protein|nr:HPP family protein [Woeseiaceae bacterium]
MPLDFQRHLRRENFKRSLVQCTLAGAVVLLLLLILDAVTQTVLIAALAASAFTAFAMPRSLHADTRHLVGGYVVGMIAGCLMSMLYAMFPVTNITLDHALMIVFGALAISLAMIVMIFTRTEHPPAAALALGLVLNEWHATTLIVILAGIIGLSLIKRLVLPGLLDLI